MEAPALIRTQMANDTHLVVNFACDLRTKDGVYIRSKVVELTSLGIEILALDYVRPGSELQLHMDQKILDFCVAWCRPSTDQPSAYEVGLLSRIPETDLKALLMIQAA